MKKILFSGCTTNKKLKTIGLSGVVALGMTVYLFRGFLNSFVLFALLLCLCAGYYLAAKAVVSDGKDGIRFDYARIFALRKKTGIERLWCLPVVSLAVGFAQGSWKMGNLIDLIIIGCCLLILWDVPRSADMYAVSVKLMGGFALFYAVSIWIQVLLPGVYEVYLNALNNGSDARINQLTNYYSGFTTSPGHTAAYIALGMCLFAPDFFEHKLRTILVEGFLLVSMFFAGMRMPVLAVGVCAFFFVMMVMPADKRMKFLKVLLITAAASLVLIVLFQKPLSKIPVLNRTFNSIQAIFKGEDASSGRIGLYKHAISLFAQHPIFGIGWGNYKATVVGVVTQSTPFDVHNIFLQLLCETGIVGCACFVTPMVYTFVWSVRHYNHLLRMNMQAVWTKLMGFSCMFQIYFLLFGMTDNSLYNPALQISYLVCCSIPVAFTRKLAERKRKRMKQSVTERVVARENDESICDYSGV